MNKGFSIIEILIAMALMIIVVSGVVAGSGGFGATLAGHQSTISDSEINSEALRKAQDLIEHGAATARQSFSDVTASGPVTDGIYKKSLTIPTAYATQCAETISSVVSWFGTYGRTLSVSATTTIVDVPNMLALGGACDISPPTGGWNPPSTYNCANFNPGKPTGIDILSKVVYMASDHAPYFYINDTNGAVLNSGCQAALSPPFITFANGFSIEGRLNDVRVGKADNGRTYAYVARDDSTKQFQVLDVTDIHNPARIASSTLASVGGSYPEGFRVFYYDNKAYITTRETAGNELHVYDVSDPGTPSSIVEIGTGFALNRTVESLVVTKKFHNGTDHYYAYMATDKNSAELTVIDITYPAPSTVTFLEIIHVDQNLSGNQDGGAVSLVSNRLYFGRLSGGASELFVFNANQPWSGLNIIAQQDIGTSVIGLAVSGQFAFLATTQASNEFKVYRSDPSNLTAVNTSFNFPNLLENGVRYSENYVYVASKGNDALRIIYSP